MDEAALWQKSWLYNECVFSICVVWSCSILFYVVLWHASFWCGVLSGCTLLLVVCWCGLTLMGAWLLLWGVLWIWICGCCPWWLCSTGHTLLACTAHASVPNALVSNMVCLLLLHVLMCVCAICSHWLWLVVICVSVVCVCVCVSSILMGTTGLHIANHILQLVTTSRALIPTCLGSLSAPPCVHL